MEDLPARFLTLITIMECKPKRESSWSVWALHVCTHTYVTDDMLTPSTQGPNGKGMRAGINMEWIRAVFTLPFCSFAALNDTLYTLAVSHTTKTGECWAVTMAIRTTAAVKRNFKKALIDASAALHLALPSPVAEDFFVRLKESSVRQNYHIFFYWNYCCCRKHAGSAASAFLFFTDARGRVGSEPCF